MKRFGIASVAFCALALTAYAVEKEIDDPRFPSWSKCGNGTSVTYESTSETEMKNVPKQKPNVSEMTYTLTDKSADKCVVATAIKGMTYKMPDQTITPKIKVDSDKYKEPKKSGPETVHAADKDWKCDVYESETDNDAGGMKSHTTSKSWICSDIPGGLVKSESHTKGDTMTSNSTMVLTKFDKK